MNVSAEYVPQVIGMTPEQYADYRDRKRIHDLFMGRVFTALEEQERRNAGH